MTEAEWMVATDPTPMMEFLRGNGTQRQFRLYSCACLRRVWELLPDNNSRRVAELAEGYADDEVSESDFTDAWRVVFEAAEARAGSETDVSALYACSALGGDDWPGLAVWEADRVARGVQDAAYWDAWESAHQWNQGEHPDRAGEAAYRAEAVNQTALLRDIFGNPFRPITFDPAWRTSTVTTLARTMYESRDFSPRPILADALQDAGGDSDDILNHLRCDGPHVRGCWALDLILGKE
jgi:hypothetical protein